MKYDKKLIKAVHGTHHEIPKQMFKDNPLTVADLKKINQKFMGGGMSQNYFAIPWFEYYFDTHNFEYVVEIGSQKGALSTYFANMAAIKETFIFDTYELYPNKHWFSREDEGTGHWFEQLANISPYINCHYKNTFTESTFNHIRENMEQFKTFIFCDGGNKLRELYMYAPFLKKDDRIAVHDWNMEVFENQAKPIMDKNNLIYEEPFATSATDLETWIMPFRKK